MALCMRAAVASLILSGLAGSGAVCAQEEGTVPGAIPDPSTYQGSMELQRQSDAQDQQFRAQQQQEGQRDRLLLVDALLQTHGFERLGRNERLW